MRTCADRGVRFGEWSEQWGREAAGLLLADRTGRDLLRQRPDRARRRRHPARGGRRIPDDIALVGFDNWQPMALGALPPLTSVDMCLEQVGRVAAAQLPCWPHIAGEGGGESSAVGAFRPEVALRQPRTERAAHRGGGDPQ